VPGSIGENPGSAGGARCVAAKEVITDRYSVSEKRREEITRVAQDGEICREEDDGDEETTLPDPVGVNANQGWWPYASLYFRCKPLSVSLSSFATSTN